MNTLYKTLLVAALLATPFAAAQAQSSRTSHEAWLKAQQIDIKPTLKITETTIPAGTPSTTPSASMPASNMPAPAATMPSNNSAAPAGSSYGSQYGGGQQPAK